MTLSEKQIDSVLFGAVGSVYGERGLHPAKCTESQIAAFASFGKDGKHLAAHARATTGIRLDFYTDSDTLAFTCSGEQFELHVDGLPIAFYRPKEDGATPESPREYRATLPEGEHRVTLLFPSHEEPGILASIELDDGATLRPHEFSRKILFSGDSITQGWNSEEDSLSFAWRITEFFNANSVIQGVGGAFFHPDIFEKTDFDPDVILVAYGTNDFNISSSVSEATDLARAYFEKVRAAYPARKIISILPIWRTDEDKPRACGTFADFRAALRAEEEALGITVIDGYDLVPHEARFYSDSVHPNKVGFGIYAERLAKELLRLIR